MAKTFNLKSFIIATLRRASYRLPSRNEAKKKARISRGLYRCSNCKGEFKQDQIKLDHIHPVVDVKTGFTSWDDYISRMFPDESGFQALCEQCHNIKSKLESEMRKEYRKLNKIVDKNSKK